MGEDKLLSHTNARMRNTYMLPGKYEHEELIKSTKKEFIPLSLVADKLT